jgi:zinc/manganese transport system ATP-binding protein
MPAEAAVTLRDLTVRYGSHVALEAVSGRFESGSLTAVVGANGAGKSTLLAAIAGTLRPAIGTVTCAARAAGRLAFLPQRATLDTAYPMTAAELITLGGWPEFGAFRAPPPALRQRASAAAATVRLTDRLARPIGALSAGELQRALFARLILRDAAVILLDEPFAAIDTPSTAVLLEQLERWHREGRTVIAALHDLDLVRARFPSTLVLARRCLAWRDTASALAALAA